MTRGDLAPEIKMAQAAYPPRYARGALLRAFSPSFPTERQITAQRDRSSILRAAIGVVLPRCTSRAFQNAARKARLRDE